MVLTLIQQGLGPRTLEAASLVWGDGSSHLHPLQVENCDSNSRLVVDEDDNGKFRLERVKLPIPKVTLKLINQYRMFFCNYFTAVRM